jgi:hypothetical protein
MPRNFNDPFTTYQSDLDSPAQYAVQITPTDDAILGTSIRALYIGGSGNVYCRPVGVSNTIDPSANILFQSVVAGTILPVRMEAVWSSNVLNTTQNTTATGLVGLY